MPCGYTVRAMITRRRFVLNTAALAFASQTRFALSETAATYRNPILGGDHPDGSPIRVGNDFYLTHSSFNYAPGLLIWHSTDLINWRPVAAALRRYYGTVWAPYLCEYQGHFYLYFPAAGKLQVVHADHPTGPAGAQCGARRRLAGVGQHDVADRPVNPTGHGDPLGERRATRR